jgi:hypothetical protein
MTRVGRLSVSVTFHSEGKRPRDTTGSADDYRPIR